MQRRYVGTCTYLMFIMNEIKKMFLSDMKNFNFCKSVTVEIVMLSDLRARCWSVQPRKNSLTRFGFMIVIQAFTRAVLNMFL